MIFVAVYRSVAVLSPAKVGVVNKLSTHAKSKAIDTALRENFCHVDTKRSIFPSAFTTTYCIKSRRNNDTCGT